MFISKAKHIILWYTIGVQIYLHYREREDIMLALKDTFKNIKDSRKVTNQEMADALGISKQNFSNKIQRNTFSPDELVKIAELLDMDIAFIDKKATVNDGEKFVIM